MLMHRGNFIGTITEGLGYYMLAFIGLFLLFNALTLLHTALRAAILCYKRLFAQRNHKKRMLQKEVSKVAQCISTEPVVTKFSKDHRRISISHDGDDLDES